MTKAQQIKGTTRVIWALVLMTFLPLALNSDHGINGGVKRATATTTARNKRG